MKKDIDLQDLKAGQNANVPSKIELSVNDEESLAREVRELLSEDFRAKALVRSLLKTTETFQHSIGNLYSFLVDRKPCLSCQDGLSKCPKKRGGFTYELRYDPQRDEIVTVLQPCSYQKSKEKAFSFIDPLDIKGDDVFRNALRFLNLVDNRPEMKDVNRAYGAILLSADNPGKDFKGLAFYSDRKEPLPEWALAFGCYYFAMNGKRCSYIKLEDLILNFRSKDPFVVEATRKDWVRAGTATALFVQDLDSLPRLSKQEAVEILFPLLQARMLPGRVTYSSLQGAGFLNSFRNLFYDCDCLNAALEDLEAIAMPFAIHDLLL